MGLGRRPNFEASSSIRKGGRPVPFGDPGFLWGAPALANSGDGRLELFVFDSTNQLFHISQTAWSNGWSGWTAMGAQGEWPATVAPSGDGRLELFAGLNHASQTAWSNGWSGWTQMPPPPAFTANALFAPGIAAQADGRLAIFVANGALWRMEQTAWSNGWSQWQSHGTTGGGRGVTGPVTAGESGDGLIYVFVLDDLGVMWSINQTAPAGGWTGWNSFGTVAPGFDDRPGLARNADGRLELFARGRDGNLYRRSQTQVGQQAPWTGWVSEGNPGVLLFDHPVIGRNADGRLEVFMSAGGAVWSKTQLAASGAWGAWNSEGSGASAFTEAAPEVGRSGDGRLELFCVGVDGNLWHKWQVAVNNGWSNWVSHGRPPDPSLTTVPDVVTEAVNSARDDVLAAQLVPVFLAPKDHKPGTWVGSQSPGAFELVPKGTTVTMQLESGAIP
jgi:hypothetical protein